MVNYGSILTLWHELVKSQPNAAVTYWATLGRSPSMSDVATEFSGTRNGLMEIILHSLLPCVSSFVNDFGKEFEAHERFALALIGIVGPNSCRRNFGL